MARREFTKPVRVAIIKRATAANGVVYCESCGLPAKRWHIDHTDADALQTDKSGKLTAEDGKLLCAEAPGTCHYKKTFKKDIPAIAQAKRREAKAIGATRPAGKIKSAGFTPTEPKKHASGIARAPAQGMSEMARRYGVKA